MRIKTRTEIRVETREEVRIVSWVVGGAARTTAFTETAGQLSAEPCELLARIACGELYVVWTERRGPSVCFKATARSS